GRCPRRAGPRLRRRRTAHLGPSRPHSRRDRGRPGGSRCFGRLFGSRRRPRHPLYGFGVRIGGEPSLTNLDSRRRRHQKRARPPPSPSGRREPSMPARQRPEPRPGVLAIEAYVPGKSAAPEAAKVFKLSSNETPLGPSPQALATYQAAGATLAEYPDGSASALREAIGRAFGLDPARIVCGAGSDELLHLLAQAFVGPDEEAIHTTHSFLIYPIATIAAGGTPVVAAEQHYTAQVDSILAAVSPRTKLVFIANPNNPTGTYLPFDEVQRLRRALPKNVLLVLDAAYAEYVRR